MRTFTLVRRWQARSSTLSAPLNSRIEVRPPSLRQAPMGSAWQRLMFWLMAPAPEDAAPPVNRLPAVRGDFLRCLLDVEKALALPVRQRIDMARSLRDLWHLRAEVYRLVALTHSQTEAEQRVASLNRHFPTRSPRSQFTPLP